MYCPICGTQNSDDARFCKSCGAELISMEQSGNAANSAKPITNGVKKAGGKKIGGKGLLIGLAALLVVVLIAGGGSVISRIRLNSGGAVKSASASKKNPEFGSMNKELGIITSYDQLKKDDLEQLYKVCMDELATKAAYNAEAEVSIVSKAELVGSIFVTQPIPFNEETNQSQLTLVYQETVNEYDRDVTYLRAFTFEQLKRLDGEFSYYYGTVGDHDYKYPLECYLDRFQSGSFEGEVKAGPVVEADGIFAKYVDCKPIGQFSDISKEGKEKLAEDAKNMIENVFVNYSEDVPEFSYMQYEGEILITGQAYFFAHNGYYAIYTATVSSADGEYGPTKLFIPVGYNDVYKLKNGDYEYRNPMLKIEGMDYRCYFGYESEETMYNELVSEVRAYTEYELSDSLQYLDELYKVY